MVPKASIEEFCGLRVGFTYLVTSEEEFYLTWILKPSLLRRIRSKVSERILGSPVL